MGWLILIVLAAIVLLVLWRAVGLSSTALELLGAALLIGIAGYAWQGRPDLEGVSKAAPAEARQPDSSFALERTKLLNRFGSDAQILDAADAMHRAGLEPYAIALIRGGIEKKPHSADLWVGMGNAMTLYAGGLVTPAAELAFQRAATLSPEHPGPPYFLGLAYAQSGQLARAGDVWKGLLARTPADAPWRAELESRLSELRAAESR